jgi:hypothetical protein
VVDAQRPRVGARSAQHADPVVVAPLAQRERVERREPPVLTVRAERVRGGAHARTGRELVAKHPGVGAARRRSECQVFEDSEGNTGLVAGARAGRQLSVELELEEAVEVDALQMRFPEAPHLTGARIAVRIGPRAPAARLAAFEVFGQRQVGGEVVERLALRLEVARVRAPARRRASPVPSGEATVQRLQDFALEGRDALVVECVGRARGLEPRTEGLVRELRARRFILGQLWDRLHIQVERISVEAARRCVRAHGVAAIPEEVEWVGADEGGAALAGEAEHRVEISEIASAPIVPAAKCVEVGREAECAPVSEGRVDLGAAVWHDDAPLARLAARTAALEHDAQFVIARAERRRQPKRECDGSGSNTAFRVGFGAVFVAQLETPGRRPRGARGQAHVDAAGSGLSLDRHAHRIQQAARFALGSLVQSGLRARLARGVEAHRRQQRHGGRFRREARFAADRLVRERDPHSLRQGPQPRSALHQPLAGDGFSASERRRSRPGSWCETRHATEWAETE